MIHTICYSGLQHSQVLRVREHHAQRQLELRTHRSQQPEVVHRILFLVGGPLGKRDCPRSGARDLQRPHLFEVASLRSPGVQV